MKHVYLIGALIWSLTLLAANAQTTYFQQDFSAGGTPATYVSASPDITQVNGLAGLSATITNNAVQFSRPTDSGTGYISRSTDFAGPPTSLHVQFSFEVTSSDVSVTGTSAVIFYVGSGFNSGPQNPPNADVYARIGLALSPAGSGQFQVRTIPSGGGGSTSSSFSGRQTITFAMNNSGFDNFNYVSPTGSLEPLPNDTYDVWVGTSKIFNDQPVLTPGQSISNFKFRLADGVGVMQIGNLLMRDISGSLPVSLLSFTAKPEGDRVQLAWSTTSERDADRFVIERSADLSEFSRVGEVAAKGTTDVRQFYGLTDMQPLRGINYYRLKQIDYDGTAHMFKPVFAIIETDQSVISVYPNPVDTERIHVRLWNVDEASVRLLNQAGQPINSKLERRSGEADLLLDHPLPTGLYWLEVQTNGQKQTTKLLVR
ncbi:T9SS type A sorting domain-containing protein [Spirosoma soli]|uniref:T9SS type A sorting domain-containing protein n=1 Tax=Spirosoma soli TaxID=1770529 RepID=A0ABW5M788_9BACT